MKDYYQVFTSIGLHSLVGTSEHFCSLTSLGTFLLYSLGTSEHHFRVIWRQTFSSTVFSKFLTTQRHFFISTGVHFFLAVVFLIVRHCFLGTSMHSCLVTSLSTGLATGMQTFLATSLHTGLETVLQTSRGTLRQLFFPPHFSSPAAQRLQYWPGRHSSSVQEQGRGAQLE